VNEQEMRIVAYVTPEATAALNAKLGRWLIAGTPIGEPYPCRCRNAGRCSAPRQCPCTGRPDPEAGNGDPTRCCGFRYPEGSEKARQVLAGGAFKWAGWQ
jgi:hypothetical protein